MAATALTVAKKKKPAAPHALRVAANRVIDLGTTSGTVVFLTRGLRALTRMAEAMPPDALTEAATADSDYAVLVAALEKPTALAELQRHDPLAETRLRGLHERQRLLAAEGGVLSGEEAAHLLGISRQAVDKRRRLGRVTWTAQRSTVMRSQAFLSGPHPASDLPYQAMWSRRSPGS